MACSVAAWEAFWLRRFLQDLEVVACAFDPITIHYDSIAALAYVNDSKYHGKTKHINVKYHYICEVAKQTEVVLEHISTSHMVANHLTKPIHRNVFSVHVRSLGLCRV